MYRAFQANKSRASLAQLQQVVNQWRAQRDMILGLSKDEVRDWFPGHAMWVDFFKTSGHMYSAIRAPFDWDFEKMMAQLASGPSKGPATLVAPRLAKA